MHFYYHEYLSTIFKYEIFTMSGDENMNIVEPKLKKKMVKLPITQRLNTLKDKIIALYDNEKITAPIILGTLKEVLKGYGVKGFIEVRSGICCSKHPDVAINKAIEADGVILATADCGSCTAWLVDAAIRIEKLAKPTCVMASEAFVDEARFNAALHGMPDLKIVGVSFYSEHPEVVQRETKKVVDKVVEALTVP